MNDNLNIILDDEEKALLDSIENNEWGSVDDLTASKLRHREAASHYLKQDKHKT